MSTFDDSAEPGGEAPLAVASVSENLDFDDLHSFLAKSKATSPEPIHAGTLSPNLETIGQVRCNEYAYYFFEHKDTSKLLTIYAAPLNKTSDPDLYVSNGDHKRADKFTNTWKSCLVGADRVDIHPSDPLAKPGMYTIGILGYTAVTDFSVKCVLSDPAPIQEIATKSTTAGSVGVGETKHFKFQVDSAMSSTVHIKLKKTCSSKSQHLQIYASNSVIYPTKDMNRWFASTYSKNGSNVAKMEIDSDDFKYTSNECFVTVLGSEEKGSQLPNLMSSLAFEEVVSQVSEVGVSSEDSTPDNDVSSEVGIAFALEVYVVAEDDLLAEELRPRYSSFKELFSGVEGGRISQNDRKNENLNHDKSFTYGEIQFVSFAELLKVCDVKPGEIFYDLGCGTGKGVMAAYYIAPFKTCCGVELLNGLYESANETRRSLLLNKELWRDENEDPSAVVSMFHANMLEHDWWSTADVIYTSSICFSDELFNALSARFDMMKPGARVCTLKTIPSDKFKTISRGWYKMSWGRCTVYILERLDN